MSAGGVEKWAAAACDKAAEDSHPTDEQQSRAQMMMATAGTKAPQSALGGSSTAAPKRFYPMLVPRTNYVTREANIFNMVFFSRSI